MAQLVKNACNAGDLGSIPGWGRAPKGGHGYPLQYSCLENPMTEETGGLQSMGSHQRVRARYEPALYPPAPRPQANSSLTCPEPCPTQQQRHSLGGPSDADPGHQHPPGLCCPHSQVPSPCCSHPALYASGKLQAPTACHVDRGRLPRGPTTPTATDSALASRLVLLGTLAPSG